MDESSSYIQHYKDLCERFQSSEEVYKSSSEEVRAKVTSLANNNQQYKYKIYLELNPNLVVSPFIENQHKLSRDIIRFRLGSHMLPIETGRWTRTVREERICRECNVLGDEKHALFHCQSICRDNLVLPNTLNTIWESDDVFALFEKMKEKEMLG